LYTFLYNRTQIIAWGRLGGLLVKRLIGVTCHPLFSWLKIHNLRARAWCQYKVTG